MKAIIKKLTLTQKNNTKDNYNINSIDFAVYKNNKKIKNIIDKILKIIIIVVFSPLIFIFYLFSIKEVSKVSKQVVVILYLIFFIVFLYTLFNQDKDITSKIETTRELNYKGKIRSYE